MNSKSQWGSNSIPRVTIHQDSDHNIIHQGIKRSPPISKEVVLIQEEEPQVREGDVKRRKMNTENIALINIKY